MNASLLAMLVGIPLGIAILLFYVLRAFVPRDMKESSPSMSGRDYIEAAVVVTGLLTLLALATFGHIWAAAVMAILLGGAKVLAMKVIAEARNKSDDK